MRWWKRQSDTLRDAVGGVPILLVFIVTEHIFGDGGSAVRASMVVLVMWTALSIRRRWPVATFVAALLTVAVAMTGLIFLAVASYTVVTYRPQVWPALVAGVSGVAATVGLVRWWPAFVLEDVAGDLIFVAAVSVLPVALGRAVRDARKRTTQLEVRNEELVGLREQAAEHAVQKERFRIARELHDVVAHHVSAMTVRARAGHHLAPRDPRAAVEALAYIAEAGTEALTAMGTFVGTLRGAASGSGAVELAPQPGLGDIPELLASFRGSGLVVEAEDAAVGVAVPPPLGLHTYRIVQEALTNVIRHGSAQRAWVRVRLTGDRLHIQVDDDGRGLRAEGCPAGQGLIGIAERVALHDGTFAVGPSPRGGCRLEATLCLGGERCQDPQAVSPAPVTP